MTDADLDEIEISNDPVDEVFGENDSLNEENNFLSEEDNSEVSQSSEALPQNIFSAMPAVNFSESDKLPYYQRYYLLYGSKPESENADSMRETLNKTRQFLSECLGYSGGELAQARNKMNEASSKNEGGFSIGYCSYCFTPLSGADYFVLSDGRYRCQQCSRSMVKTEDELKEIYAFVKKTFNEYLGVNINEPVSFDLISEKKLKRKLFKSLEKVKDKETVILGVAVKKKKKYTIYLENGAPRISVIATLAHELTHVWQYTNWNDMELKKNCGKNLLEIYEGMAKWVEIQFLYFIGEFKMAKREEVITNQRKDEYHDGFVLYYEHYGLKREANVVPDNPFLNGNNPL